MLYRLPALLQLPPVIVCPIAAIALNYLFFIGANPAMITLLNALALLHYFNESTIWKKGSLHRESLSFAH